MGNCTRHARSANSESLESKALFNGGNPAGEPVTGLTGARSGLGVRRDKAALSSGCKAHPAKSLPPEAIGAVMEVTKWLKPSISVSRIGDSASGQAATRVNAEQASHGAAQVKGPHQGSINKPPVALAIPGLSPI